MPVRPVSQPSLQSQQPQLPPQQQTRSRGPLEIGSLFNIPSPPDVYRRKTALPTQMVSAVNASIPINTIEETADNREIVTLQDHTIKDLLHQQGPLQETVQGQAFTLNIQHLACTLETPG